MIKLTNVRFKKGKTTVTSNNSINSQRVDELVFLVEPDPGVSDGWAVLVLQLQPQIPGSTILQIAKRLLWNSKPKITRFFFRHNYISLGIKTTSEGFKKYQNMWRHLWTIPNPLLLIETEMN